MKTPTYEPSAGALAAFLATNLTVQPVDLWTITLKSGAVLRYTGGDFDAPVFAGRASVATYIDANGILQTAAADMPRFFVDPVSGPRLFMEPAATNYAINNSLFEWAETTPSGPVAQLRWRKLAAATAPDGTLTALKVCASPDSDLQRLYYVTPTVEAGASYVYSVFAKKGEYSRIALRTTTEVGVAMVVDLDSGTIIQGSNAVTQGVRYLGDGWYRLFIQYVAAASGGVVWVNLVQPGTLNTSFTGNGTDGLYLWGGMIEKGASPTSVIATGATVVSRAADTANTFMRGPAIKRTRTKQSVGISVDSMSLELYADSTVQVAGMGIVSAIALGFFDGASVQLDHAFFDASMNLMGILPAFAGTVGQVQTERGRATMDVRSSAELLDIQVPGDLYQPACKNTVFDSYCGLNGATYTQATTIAGADATNSVLAAPGLTGGLFAQTAPFMGGLLTLTSGANAGVTRTIKAAATLAGGGLSLQVMTPFPSAVGGGESATVRSGCPKTMAACSGWYNNLPSFRGEPFIPAPETVT